MSGSTVLLLEPLHPDARAALADAATVFELEDPHAPLDGVPLGDVTAIITRGRGQVNGALLEQLPALRVVARAGVGLDNVDRVACAARDVVVINVPDALTITVAEHAVALALAARRGIAETAAAARDGRWAERLSYGGASVAGSRATVLGAGAIGLRTAKLLRALGAEVTVWNRSESSDPGFEPDRGRALDGAELVSLHTALTPETRGSFGAAELARLAPGCTVVNTARPALVEPGAMLASLEEGRVGAYAVDGFEPEPPPLDDPLLAHPRVLVTPHVAALTRETFRDLCLATVEGTLHVLDGRAPAGAARIVAHAASA